MTSDPPKTAAATAAAMAKRPWLTTRKCAGTKRDGSPCRAIARGTSKFCPRHAAAPRATALGVVKAIRSGSPESLVDLIGAAAEDVLAGRITPQQASSIAALAHAGMKAYDIGDLERQIRALERDALLAAQSKAGAPFEAALDFEFPPADEPDGEGG